MNDNVKGFLVLTIMGLEAYICGRLSKKFIGASYGEAKGCLPFLRGRTRRTDVIKAIMESESINNSGRAKMYELIEEGRKSEYYTTCLSIIKDPSTNYWTKQSRIEELNKYFY